MNAQLAFLSRNNADNSWIWAMLGACAGLYLFYRGFRILQRKRLILNTPTSKIRSASLGLVEVNGLAVGPYTMIAPITGMPCFYYRTLAWELRKSGKSQEWHKVADEGLHVPFYLDDNTGQVLVNPQGAEMDIHRDFHEEYSNSIFSSHEMPANVSSFLTRHSVAGEHKIRIDEYCIKPKNALFIFGTLAENPGLSVSPRPIPTQHAAQLTFNLPGTNSTFGIALESTPSLTMQSMNLKAFRQEAGGPMAEETIKISSAKYASTATEMAQQGKIAAALVKAGITNPAAWAAAGIENPAGAIVSVGGPVIATGAAGAAARIAPDFDLQPKVVMMKGENNPSFLISWRSQREVVRSLGWKSVACIWGGPILTLLSVYVLLARFGWL
ncbi:MAG TPA: GIDE domain-containing protein [Terriglobales bacterium]|nr:GIDE domain-containing protein [Terriglobales bacterium]